MSRLMTPLGGIKIIFHVYEVQVEPGILKEHLSDLQAT